MDPVDFSTLSYSHSFADTYLILEHNQKLRILIESYCTHGSTER